MFLSNMVFFFVSFKIRLIHIHYSLTSLLFSFSIWRTFFSVQIHIWPEMKHSFAFKANNNNRTLVFDEWNFQLKIVHCCLNANGQNDVDESTSIVNNLDNNECPSAHIFIALNLIFRVFPSCIKSPPLTNVYVSVCLSCLSFVSHSHYINYQ